MENVTTVSVPELAQPATSVPPDVVPRAYSFSVMPDNSSELDQEAIRVLALFW